jgi:hypothetical protein
MTNIVLASYSIRLKKARKEEYYKLDKLPWGDFKDTLIAFFKNETQDITNDE